MFAETLGIIASGVTIVNSISKLIKNRQGSKAASPSVKNSVSQIERRIASIERAMARSSAGQNENIALARAYVRLTKAIAEDPNYSTYLTVKKTDYGTIKIVRKRKKNILRDPKGEYCL